MEKSESQCKQGSLVIAGCGLHPGHMTLETQSHIQHADIVLVVAPNALSVQQIRALNPNIENLGLLYKEDTTRLQTYYLMVDRMEELVQSGKKVCTIYYGHPGIFVLSTHIARDRLEQQGYSVKMLPGISADACLFADLNLDPATTGCQAYESTQFLLTARDIDNGAALILWQIGLVGEHTLKLQQPGKRGLSAITRLLMEHYPSDHKVCLYEAPTLPGFDPRIDWIELEDLPAASVKSITTLVVPSYSELNFAKERLEWLGLTEADLSAWDQPVKDEKEKAIN
ncbi:SAM-dependent methyltransferase [Aliikangiella coralliicola]|uniref:Methylase n=1 Tax=Aliikangiella coralliicola TaxID=2592383 RepID=A0A545U8K6_9GAMM|nr:SAM-dependent methyltransferase [Aliikangiella coralliicola]TQV85802.1 methylase [Aliikangiella coralliicola]